MVNINYCVILFNHIHGIIIIYAVVRVYIKG